MTRTRFVHLLLAAILGGACGDQGPATVPGTYVLETLDGKESPFNGFVNYSDAVIDGQLVLVETQQEFISDTLQLRTDGTLQETRVLRHTVRAFDQTGALVLDSTWVDAFATPGTYAVAGGTVEIAYSNGQTATGSVDGDVLELLRASGSKARYRRRG